MSEDKKEFKQAYLEEKLQAIADKLGDAYGEPFLSELISRMERTVSHFNEEVDIMLSSVKANTKERQKHFSSSEGDILSAKISEGTNIDQKSNSQNSNGEEDESEASNEENGTKKKKFSLFKRKKKK